MLSLSILSVFVPRPCYEFLPHPIELIGIDFIVKNDLVSSKVLRDHSTSVRCDLSHCDSE